MRKFKNAEWTVTDSETGKVSGWQGATVSVLMDLRDELQELNRHVKQIASDVQPIANSARCKNFQRLPAKLDRIGRAADKLVATIQAGGKS